MKLKKRKRKNARIEIIPLIDIMFLLLVFFIYAMLSMSVHRGIAIELPFAKSSLLENSSYHDISITKNGEVFLDKSPITLDKLPVLLAELKRKNPRVEIRISGDKKSVYEMIIKIMDSVRSAGIEKISLETTWRETL